MYAQREDGSIKAETKKKETKPKENEKEKQCYREEGLGKT